MQSEWQMLFVGNPLEEKHSAEGNWRDEAIKRLPRLKKLDGEFSRLQVVNKLAERLIIESECFHFYTSLMLPSL